MKAIVNARVVLESEVVPDGVLLMDGEKIVDVGSAARVKVPAGCETIDAQGLLAAPGFVDNHCHAGGAYWAWQDPAKMAAHHLAHGTTSLNCTIFHDIGEDGAYKAMDDIRAAMDANTPGNIMGIHFEGPFLNPTKGANAKTIRPVDKREYERHIAHAADIINMWTVSPEIPHAMELIDALREAGIKIAMGHSAASVAEVAEAVLRGASICTHITNATGYSVQPDGGGILECDFNDAVMLQDNIYCELINDKDGVHVHHDKMRLLVKQIGVDWLVGVTDACTGAVDDTDVNIINGELYGSKLTMDAVARNFRDNTRLGVTDVFKICSRNPARAMGFGDRFGTLAPGKLANVIVIDDDYHVKKLFLKGADRSAELA